MQLVVVGALVGLSIAFVVRRSERSGTEVGTLAGLTLFLLFLVAEVQLGFSGNPLLNLGWIGLVTVGWGAATGAAVMATAAPSGEVAVDSARRSALLKVAGGSLGLALGAWGAGRLLAEEQAAQVAETGASQPLSTAAPAAAPTAAETAATPTPAAVTPTPDLENRLEPAPGTRPEVTDNEDFYRIDINTRSPMIDREEWTLEVDGLFQNPRSLTLDDLMAYPAITQPITLSCISNRIGGDLIGTSYWTGARLRDVLADLQLAPEAGALFLEAEDGFYETVTAADMMDERTLLVYGMNGETLPVEHGFPLRIYIPNRYGMKQPKWIVRMEAMEAWAPGYWVERGWSREARPHIVSVIDTVAEEATTDGRIPIGGIAWAGDRGIQKVEVQVDDGEWAEAQLRKPPLSTLTWVQWRYDWPAEEGRRTFTVRATDGTGTLQIAEETGVRPDGATGYHSVNRTI